MSFLKPAMLLALLGALVPILIHLIHKRRPRKKKFAAIELLLKSVERVERRWRLRRFLLLLSRVALLAALALAAAGPLLQNEAGTAIARGGPERVAIVLDGSLSMRATYDGTMAFTQAVKEARNIIDRLGPEDQAVLAVARQKPGLLVKRPTGSKQTLLSALKDLTPSFEAADSAEAVSAGAQALGSLADQPSGDQNQMAFRVVLLSDMAEPGFQKAADLSVPGTGHRAKLEIVDVLKDVSVGDRSNRAIRDLETANIPGRAPRTVEFRSRIQAFAPQGARELKPADLTLRSQDQDLWQGSVDLVGGTIVDKVVHHAFASPGHTAVELLLDPDVLSEDDRRFFVVDVRRQVRTLIVDGAPSGVPKEDEVFYLERALAVGARDHPPPKVITADDLPKADLAAFDVVVLAGVPSFSRNDGARLVEFVEKGGGLLLSAATDLDVELYNAELGRILPRPLRGLKVVDPQALPGREDTLGPSAVGSGGVVTLAKLKTGHPIMEIFKGEGLRAYCPPGLLPTCYFNPGGQRDERADRA